MIPLHPQNCSVRQTLVLNMFFKRRNLGSRKVKSWMEWVIDLFCTSSARACTQVNKDRGAGMAAHWGHRTMPFLLTLSPTSTPEAITSDSKYILHQDMAIKGTFASCHILLMYWWLYCWLRLTNSFRINILYSIPSCSYKNYQENIIVMV